MNQLQISNCTRLQEIILKLKLSKIVLPQGKLEISFDQHIYPCRCHSYWYCGDMAVISYQDYHFIISAEGDMIISLQSKADMHAVARVKDKGGDSIFEAEMGDYIENDNRLRKIISGQDAEYSLSIDQDNWFELSVMDKNYEPCGVDVVLDSELIFDAVAEAVSEAESIIKRLKEEPQPA